jgi:hypothetical protein
MWQRATSGQSAANLAVKLAVSPLGLAATLAGIALGAAGDMMRGEPFQCLLKSFPFRCFAGLLEIRNRHSDISQGRVTFSYPLPLNTQTGRVLL